MSDVVNTALLVFAGLFPVVNPLGNASVFRTMTRQCTDEERHVLGSRVPVNGFLLLLGSLLVGSHVLTFFGLTLPVVRVAGGLVVAATGWKLLSNGEDQQDHGTASTAPDHMAPPDSFYPLTMPPTVGPESITVAIVFGSRRPAPPESFGHLALLTGAAVADLLAIAATFASGLRSHGTATAR